MNLHALGKLVAERRRAKELTLRALATASGVGRSTLAALESGKLAELGYAKLARVCSILDLVLEARPFTLEAEFMPHRHLTEPAGRDLTKAAIEDIVLRGTIYAWRELVKTARGDRTQRVARRVREVLSSLDKSDPKARAFSTLLPEILPKMPVGPNSRA